MSAAPENEPPREDERLAAIAELLRRAEGISQPSTPPLALGEYIIEAARVPQRHRGTLLQLTPTELTCMRFLGWGRANADIASLLMISENTVRVHLNNACRKLELDGMRELAALSGLLFYSIS